MRIEILHCFGDHDGIPKLLAFHPHTFWLIHTQYNCVGILYHVLDSSTNLNLLWQELLLTVEHLHTHESHRLG